MSAGKKKPHRNPPPLLVVASREDRINHLPASVVSVLGPEDGGNKTGPSGTHHRV